MGLTNSTTADDACQNSTEDFTPCDLVDVMESCLSSDAVERVKRLVNLRATLGVILGAECTIANLFLIVSLMMQKEFRQWIFYPIIFQSVIDLLGPGMGNME